MRRVENMAHIPEIIFQSIHSQTSQSTNVKNAMLTLNLKVVLPCMSCCMTNGGLDHATVEVHHRLVPQISVHVLSVCVCHVAEDSLHLINSEIGLCV
jgi:hypothetical protein